MRLETIDTPTQVPPTHTHASHNSTHTRAPTNTRYVHPRLGDAECTSVAKLFCTEDEMVTFRAHLNLNCDTLRQLVGTYDQNLRVLANAQHRRDTASSSKRVADATTPAGRRKRSRRTPTCPENPPGTDTPSGSEARKLFMSGSGNNTTTNQAAAIPGTDQAAAIRGTDTLTTHGVVVLPKVLVRAREKAVACLASDNRPYLAQDPPPEPHSHRPTKQDPNTLKGWERRASTFFSRVGHNSWNEVRGKRHISFGWRCVGWLGLGQVGLGLRKWLGLRLVAYGTRSFSHSRIARSGAAHGVCTRL